MRDVRMKKWFGFWSIWFAIGLHSPNHANHGKPTTKVWIVLPPDAGGPVAAAAPSMATTAMPVSRAGAARAGTGGGRIAFPRASTSVSAMEGSDIPGGANQSQEVAVARSSFTQGSRRTTFFPHTIWGRRLSTDLVSRSLTSAQWAAKAPCRRQYALAVGQINRQKRQTR